MAAPEVTQASKGLYMDVSPLETPKGAYRFALNAVPKNGKGERKLRSNEKSTFVCTSLPSGYILLGSVYLGDDTIAVWLSGEKDLIGIVDKNDKYTTIVETSLLNLKNQVDAIFRLRRGNEKVVYWVDGENRPRTFNFTRSEQFYSTAYSAWLRVGNSPNTFIGEKWDGSAFDLIKTYQSIPRFDKVEVLDYGNITPGSYNFAIQYLDENLNPTEWITTSNTVNIFNDSLDKPYHRIRGSRNTQSDSQNFGKANKSIRLTLTDLDTNYPYYRIAIIEGTSNTGKATRALASNVLTTRNPIFIYSGNDGQLSEVSLQDIIIDGEVILSPQHIEQIENKLILASTKSSSYNWCDFQKYASKITSDLVTEQVILDSVVSPANQKNPNSTFMFRGYMPGEVYSFGIVYLMKDNSLSPVYTIPGKASTVSNNMAYHELDTPYVSLHDCLGQNDFWGRDANGNSLTNTPIRHHKFKTRKELNKPLVSLSETTININKYKLGFKLSLKPGKSWPTDGGTPRVIRYSIQYQPSYASSPITYSGYVSISDLDTEVVFYDDIYSFTTLGSGNNQDFTTDCELISIYNPSGDETFDIEYTNDTYVDSRIRGASTSEIFGISFSNITKPHPDVVGFYIVRNERLDDDRIVIDNAIIGNNQKSSQYSAFGLWTPKVEDTRKDSNATWFWSPEHQFLRKKLNFTSLHIDGVYTEVLDPIAASKLGPLSFNSTGTPDAGNFHGNFGIRGVLIQDVYPGTSYNSDVHKKNNKDDDGFSLAVGYRRLKFSYANAGSQTLPTIDEIIYLDACASKQISNTTYYNTSCDNKIGMISYQDSITLSDFYDSSTPAKSKLLYASLLVDNKASYGDFLTRAYYKEHNNPVLFGDNDVINNHHVFNGDAFISPANLTSTVFWEQRIADRDKKNKTWQIIAGAVLVVVGVVAAIFTAGAGLSISAVGVGMLAALAISYGVSLAMSGIKFEQMKNMIDNDYPKGLKECVKDQDTVYSLDGDETYPGPQASGTYPNDINGTSDDDMFMWFADRLNNIWVESTIPYAIRVGLTSGTPDFIDGPTQNFDREEFHNYLTEKLTILDKDRGSGRLYKGYPSAEVYDVNLDYMRYNKEKVFQHLPVSYDCCAVGEGGPEVHPMRVWASETAFQEERDDNYRVFLPNNYIDIEGEHGEITDLFRLGNSLYVHTKESLWLLPQNIQERVTDQIVSFIGTGNFFSIPPRKIVDDTLGSAGTHHKWATQKARGGIIFFSTSDKSLWFYGDKLKNISEGVSQFLQDNGGVFLEEQLFRKFGIQFLFKNTPASPNGVGFISGYDTDLERYLLTKKDYKLTDAYYDLLSLISAPPSNLHEIAFFPLTPYFYYCTSNGLFYKSEVTIDEFGIYHRDGSVAEFSDTTIFENKSFTLSYDLVEGSWIGFHSYLPNFYLSGKSSLYSFKAGLPSLWKHNSVNNFQTFYGEYSPFIIETTSSPSPLETVEWDNIYFQTQGEVFDITSKEWVDVDLTFNKAILYTSEGTTGERSLIIKGSDAGNFLFNQITNRVDGITISRNKRDWCLNEIRDYRIDYSTPFWTKSWTAIKSRYWIDKVINTSAVDFNKHWSQLGMLKDKYLCLRFILDDPNKDNLNLTYLFGINPTENVNL